ncbi:hypothetical protein EDC04DRAFT_714632 [Pisolithus marmoratus]|nr:hypothetical protein EDC04DRAFT_714632 [Pisolithus marmoratus]
MILCATLCMLLVPTYHICSLPHLTHAKEGLQWHPTQSKHVCDGCSYKKLALVHHHVCHSHKYTSGLFHSASPPFASLPLQLLISISLPISLPSFTTHPLFSLPSLSISWCYSPSCTLECLDDQSKLTMPKGPTIALRLSSERVDQLSIWSAT